MGIYIKNMEMPMNCRLCPLWKFIHVSDGIKDYCDAAKKAIDEPFEKPDWCPLVDITFAERLG